MLLLLSGVVSLGALAATGNAVKRSGAGVPLGHVIRAPFAGYVAERNLDPGASVTSATTSASTN